MKQVKGIPYGISNFEQVRNEGKYYVDKTMYLPLLEETGNYLFLIRPRRFGKSLFVSMMRAYYDTESADRFDSLFDGLWVKEHPTQLKNSFQMVYFDFSLANVGGGTLKENLDSYCGIVLNAFIERYSKHYGEAFAQRVKAAADTGDKLTLINAQAHELGFTLYLIIDEYDNFTNVVLTSQGQNVFHDLTHASGFYREYFKLFKAMFDRVFLIGVSPVTLDDLSSGYNIDWGISTDPRFNAMLGFSEIDVRTMFRYYQDSGKLVGDIDAMIAEMRPWYDNYCFAEECLDEPRVFNCGMTLFYLRNRILYGASPKEMVDKNIRDDYSKLKMLADIDVGIRREKRMSVIEEIAARGYVHMALKTSFPAERVVDENNFRSLLYYYGMLTIGGTYGSMLKMVIPNNCVQEQYWTFMRDYFQSAYHADAISLEEKYNNMAFEGGWQAFVTMVAEAYRENSSVRDSILGDHNLQGFFKAYLSLTNLYVVRPEVELAYGYSDFLLMPDRNRYPDIGHSYIIELKYVKPTASDGDVAAKSREADGQLDRYSGDKAVIRLCAGTRLHLIKLVFRGAQLVVCEER